MTDERLVWQELIESPGWHKLAEFFHTQWNAERLVQSTATAFKKYGKRETQVIELADALSQREGAAQLLAYPQQRIAQLTQQAEEAERQAAVPHTVRRRA